MSQQAERTSFGSRFGAILATAGSAVGLGNVWRFPYETGNHGGAAFILIYLACVLFLGLPIVIAEFTVGRHSKASTGKSFKVLAPGTPWRWVGYMGVACGLLIVGFYCVVAGWTLEYIVEAGMNGFADKTADDFIAAFSDFSESPVRPVLWLIAFLLLTHYVIVKGVKRGIEKSSKVLMPILFVLIVVLVCCSVMLPNAERGLAFLLQPDFSKVDGSVFLGAMSQAFFSLSLGMGCLTTYSSYFSDDTKLVNTAVNVVVIDTVIAILAGLIIFPAAFSVGIQPDAGPSLVFITLPNVFQQAFGSVPVLSYLFSLLFYFLLALAALTSMISMHEVVTAHIHETFGVTRGRSAVIVTAIAIVLGVLSSLSLGIGQHYTVCGMTFFDLLDFLTAKLMLPLGGFFTSLFVGWVMTPKDVYDEFTNGGQTGRKLFYVYRFLLRYVAPIIIARIFLNELGWL
jgi:NSS family neurotransmitter:Na+ symporter